MATAKSSGFLELASGYLSKRVAYDYLQPGVLQFNIHRRNQEMLLDRAENNGWRKPLRVWLTVLIALFCTEAVVMEIIPWIIPAHAPRLLEAMVDAFILTTVTAPILWFLIVRPLQDANRLRTQFLSDLFASIEVERRQIAHELHDGVGQSLTLLISGLQTVVYPAPWDTLSRPSANKTFWLLSERLRKDRFSSIWMTLKSLQPSIARRLASARRMA